MSRAAATLTRVAEASAPLAALLADGLALAIDRRASCRVEPAVGLMLEDKGALLRFTGAALDAAEVPPGLQALARVLHASGAPSALHAVAHGRVPTSTGLGVLAALGLSAASAISVACEQRRDDEAAARCVEGALGTSPALRLALAASRLGQAVAFGEDGGVRRVAADPAWLEQALMLVDTGVPARLLPAGDDERPAPRASELVMALEQGADLDVPTLIAAAWAERVAQVPAVATPEVESVLALARRAGGAGRPCGPGGGGLVLLWLPVGAHAALRVALTQAGLRVFPCRLDLLGLDVEAA